MIINVFCTKYCMNKWKVFRGNRKKPTVAPISDWNENEWKKERKMKRPKRLKSKQMTKFIELQSNSEFYTRL